MSSLFAPAPEPKSLLGYYRTLSPTAGVKVSPLCLGAMNFGDAWKEVMGECNKETSFQMMDFFKDQGGNFIDTANNYQSEQSEQWIGEWMTSRKCRDEMVLATKYTTGWKYHEGFENKIHANFGGNNKKSLHVSVKESLKKLQTDYIDLLWIHWWDHTTSIPEIMQSLDDLVKRGTVLYLGASDMPAWIVSKANQYARDHGLRQFCVYQGQWSAANREFERDIIPMCRDEGMGLTPWGALGGGNFKTKAQWDSGEGRKMFPPSEAQLKVSAALEKIANRKNSIITSIALAYVMKKTPYVFPIVGGRKIEHLKGNIEALSIDLSDEEVKEIDDAFPFVRGFPHDFVGDYAPNWLHATIANFDIVDRTRPIELGKHKPN